VSGVIYPPDFLKYVKQQARAFEHCCPAADDIWLTVNALRAGFKVAQVKDAPEYYSIIAGSQTRRLSASNVDAGGNQAQLLRTFSAADLSKLNDCLLAER
jgi:hypothetical protein